MTVLAFKPRHEPAFSPPAEPEGNPIGRISGPPGWELKRHGGPITERIHARERVRLFRELKDLEYEASLYKDSATTKREKAELRAVEAKIAALRLRLGIGSR